MEHGPGIIKSADVQKPEEVEIRSVEKEKLEEIMKEYKEDPDNFYRKNAWDLWEGGKNPALMFSVEQACNFIKQIWEEQGLGKADKVLVDARNVAMVVMKYLGADIEGWCKVDIETVTEVSQQMGEKDFKEKCQFILEKIKRNDPVFAHFLAEISVRDPKTGELREDKDMVAIVNMINVVVRTMYEQMLKNAKIN